MHLKCRYRPRQCCIFSSSNFHVRIKSSSPLFSWWEERKQSVDSSSITVAHFFPPVKGELFHPLPLPCCCHRVGDDHKREAKKSDSFECITFYSHAKLYMGNGHGMPGPATLGQKKNATTISFSLSNKIFPELPSCLSHYQRCLGLCHMIKAILAVSHVLYLRFRLALPPTFFK